MNEGKLQALCWVALYGSSELPEDLRKTLDEEDLTKSVARDKVIKLIKDKKEKS